MKGHNYPTTMKVVGVNNEYSGVGIKYVQQQWFRQVGLRGGVGFRVGK